MVKEEVVKEVMVPGETVVVKEEVIKTVEVPGETVTVEVVKTVEVPARPWWWRKRSSRPSRSPARPWWKVGERGREKRWRRKS